MREWGDGQRGGGGDVKRTFVRYRSRCVWLLSQQPTTDLQPTDIQGYRFSGTGAPQVRTGGIFNLETGGKFGGGKGGGGGGQDQRWE